MNTKHLYFIVFLALMLCFNAPFSFAANGGPDGFGYSWKDSNEGSGPALFDWNDISATGTVLSLADDSFTAVTLPFTFPFYGDSKTTLYISSNGYIGFSSASMNSTNGSIPSTTNPDDIIAPFWTDLNPAAGGSICYKNDLLNGKFIVQWTDVPMYNETYNYTFQVILYVDGTIKFQYNEMDSPKTATIGVENNNGTIGLLVADNTTDYVTNGLAVIIDSYCTTYPSYLSSLWTTNIQIGDLYERNSGNDNGYIYTGDIIDMNVNQAYSVTFVGENDYAKDWIAWIDLNQDGDFEDANEQVYTASNSFTTNGTITIPATATLGYTRMRISQEYWENGYPGSCEIYSWGETEDFILNIKDPDLILSNISPTATSQNICGYGNEELIVNITNNSAGVLTEDFDIEATITFPDGTETIISHTVTNDIASGANVDITIGTFNTTTGGEYSVNIETQAVSVENDLIRYSFVVQEAYNLPYNADINGFDDGWWTSDDLTINSNNITGTYTSVNNNGDADTSFIASAKINIPTLEQFLAFDIDTTNFGISDTIIIKVINCDGTVNDVITTLYSGNLESAENTYSMNDYLNEDIRVQFVIITENDLNFTIDNIMLEGHDVSPVDIIIDQVDLLGATNCGFATEPLKVEIENIGNIDINTSFDITVTATYQGSTVFTETVTHSGALPSGVADIITFSNLNSDAYGNYELTATTNLIYDPGNNELTESFTTAAPDYETYSNSFSAIDNNWSLDNANFNGAGDLEIMSNNLDFDGEEAIMISPFIGPVPENADLAFHYRIETSSALNDMGSGDKIHIQISTDCGYSWTTLKTIDMYNQLDHSDGEMFLHPTIDMAAYEGEEVYVRFYAVKGDPASSTNWMRFYLDDFHFAIPELYVSDILTNKYTTTCGLSNEAIGVIVNNDTYVNLTENVDIAIEFYNPEGTVTNETVTIQATTSILPGDPDTVYFSAYNTEIIGEYELIAHIQYVDANVNNNTYSETIETADPEFNEINDGFNDDPFANGWYQENFNHNANSAQSSGIFDEDEAFMMTPFIGPIGEYTKMAFDYRIQTDATSDSLGTGDNILIQVSNDCGYTWTTLYSIDSASQTAFYGNWTLSPTIDLSAYAGQDIYVRFYAYKDNNGAASRTTNIIISIDNVYIGRPDVYISNIIYPNNSNIDCGTPSQAFGVYIYNNSPITASEVPYAGEVTASNFEDQIFEDTYTNLAPYTTVYRTLGYVNTTVAQEYYFTAYTALEYDADPSNDAMDYTLDITPEEIPYSATFDVDNENWNNSTGFAWDGTYFEMQSNMLSYGDGNVSMTSPRIGLLEANSRLTFKYFVAAFNDYSGYYFREGDTLFVEVSDNCQSSWNQIHFITNSNHIVPDDSNPIRYTSVDLGAYAGQFVHIRFVLKKANEVGITYVAIDDIHINNGIDVEAVAIQSDWGDFGNYKICGSENEMIQVAIQNNGFGHTGDFTTKLSIFHEGDSITQLSQTVSLDGNVIDTIEFGPVNTVAPGKYNFKFYTEVENDLDYSNNDLNPGGNELVVQALNTIPFEDDTYTAEGWWVYNFTNLGNALKADMENNDTAAVLAPKSGPLTGNTELIFSYHIDKYDKNSSQLIGHYLDDGDIINVLYSQDCGETFEIIYTVNNSNHIDSDEDTLLRIDMSAYSGTQGAFALQVVKGDIGYFTFHLERFRVHTPQPDVNFVSIITDPSKCGQEDEPVEVVLINNTEFDELTNIDVELDIVMDGSVEQTISYTYTGTLEPGDADGDTVLVGTFNSIMPALYEIQGMASLTGDINLTNNDDGYDTFNIFELLDNNYTEDFEGGDENKWDYDNMVGFATVNEAQMNALNPGDTAMMTSPVIGTIEANNTLTFDYMLNAGTMTLDDRFYVMISNDCEASYDTVLTIQNEENVTMPNGQWWTENIDLATYAGDNIVVRFEAFNKNTGSYTMYIDNFAIVEPDAAIINYYADLDMNLIDRHVACGEENQEVFINIQNTGMTILENVPVNVFKDGVEETYILTETLQPGATALLSIGTVNTTQPGKVNIVAVANVDNDTEISNDTLGIDITTQLEYGIPYEALEDDFFVGYWEFDENGNMVADVADVNTWDLQAFSLNMHDTAYAILPKLTNITENTNLAFDYMAANSVYAHIIHEEAIHVMVSSDCQDTWEELLLIDVNLNDSTANGREEIDLGAYAGMNIRIAFMVTKGNSEGTFTAQLSDISIANHVPVTISVSDSEICQGDITTLDAGFGYDFYNWFKIDTTDNGEIVNTWLGNSNQLVVGTSGSYYVAVNNAIDNITTTDTVFILVNPLPEEAAAPTGDLQVYNNVPYTEYTTTGSTYATSYIWTINPASAGNIVGTTDTAIVHWNQDFLGTALISVHGINDCGEGAESNNINVSYEPVPIPEKAATPIGDLLVYNNVPYTEYTTAGATNATSYIWSISPASAGNIVGTTDTATVHWNQEFIGTALISVRGINEYGEGAESNSINVSYEPVPIPEKAATPEGDLEVCNNNPTTEYSTAGATYATSYIWSISPATAGNIVGTTDTAIVYWNADYAGTALISVHGINQYGEGQESNNINVEINPAPFIPNAPEGSTDVCNNETATTYITTGSTNATGYEWQLIPANAGVITSDGLTATVDWNEVDNYDGTAIIKVRAQNDCGYGLYSDELVVNINGVPEIPGQPSTTSQIICNHYITEHSTTGSDYSTSYIWLLEPAEAGTINGTGTTVMIDWNDDYTGNVDITVLGKNNCGESVASEATTVIIDECIGITETNVENLSVYPNPASDKLFIEGVGMNMKGQTHIQMFNSFGAEVLSKDITTDEKEIDVNNLPAGMYMIKVTYDNQFKIFRVVVE